MGQEFTSFTPEPFPLGSHTTLICPFWADADPRDGGDVYSRITEDSALLQRASHEGIQINLANQSWCIHVLYRVIQYLHYFTKLLQTDEGSAIKRSPQKGSTENHVLQLMHIQITVQRCKHYKRAIHPVMKVKRTLALEFGFKIKRTMMNA